MGIMSHWFEDEDYIEEEIADKFGCNFTYNFIIYKNEKESKIIDKTKWIFPDKINWQNKE